MPFFVRRLLVSISLLVIGLCLLEGLLRILGYTPRQEVITDIQTSPAPAFRYDSVLGLRLNPGNFRITINDSLTYSARHEANGRRTALSGDKLARPEWWILGCSFAYGMGVNDEETFAARVQADKPGIRIRNFGVPAYGTVHGWLQLRAELHRGEPPERVILAYTTYQDARNQLSGLQQKYWRETLLQPKRPGFARARMPFVIPQADSFQVGYLPYSDFKQYHTLSGYSVVVARLEQAVSNIWYGFTDKHQLTEQLVAAMQQLCQKQGTEFAVMGLDQSVAADSLAVFCHRKGIPWIDATLDMHDPANNLAPYDSHPNAEAHAFYAQKLLKYVGREPESSE